MIELEKTYISSSMEAQIAEMMGRDEKSNDYRFYHLFSSLVFRENRLFSFLSRKKRSSPLFSVEVLLLPLTPKHGFPSLFSVCRISGRSPSDSPASALFTHCLCRPNVFRKMPASTVSYYL